MITKEERLRAENQEEVWGLIENFLHYWKEEHNKKYPEMPTKLIYDFMPTDMEVNEIVKEMVSK